SRQHGLHTASPHCHFERTERLLGASKNISAGVPRPGDAGGGESAALTIPRIHGEGQALLLQIFDERPDPEHEDDDDEYPYEPHTAHHPVHHVCHHVSLLCPSSAKS